MEEAHEKKPARNFQRITGSPLRRQYVVILTSQKQSKETENRGTPLYILYIMYTLVVSSYANFLEQKTGFFLVH